MNAMEKIDYHALRDWLRAMSAGSSEDRAAVHQVLEAIYEAATARQKESIVLFMEDGLSIGEVAKERGVSAGTAVHSIQRGLNNARSALIHLLPKEMFAQGEEPAAEAEEPPHEEERAVPKAVVWREGKNAGKTGAAEQKKVRLYMTEEEVAVRYRQARNQAEQIAILADLNLTTKEVIREVLREQGEDVPEPKKKHGRAPSRKAPLPIWEDIEAAETLPEEEEEIMPKTEMETMSIEVLAELTKNVKNAFCNADIHMAAGAPVGALLTVHWNSKGEVSETVLLIEAAG